MDNFRFVSIRTYKLREDFECWLKIHYRLQTKFNRDQCSNENKDSMAQFEINSQKILKNRNLILGRPQGENKLNL